MKAYVSLTTVLSCTLFLSTVPVQWIGAQSLPTPSHARAIPIQSRALPLTTSPPPGSPVVLPVPQANACESSYDSFYESEPGVYAYWALCEATTANLGYDYLGAWPLVKGFQPNPAIYGGQPGPVPDGETAAHAPDATSKLEQQGIFLNKHAGTLATWINADASSYPVIAESMSAVNGISKVGIMVSKTTELCFTGILTTATGQTAQATNCTASANAWHRVVMTWDPANVVLYVDGIQKASTTYTGTIGDSIFYYQLFQGCCSTGKQMTLAKALLANRTWTPTQVTLDFTPAVITPPQGGVEISTQALGTVHADVLGYVDDDQDLSQQPIVSALLSGLTTAGAKAVRYAGGGFADAEDWRGGTVDCTATPGTVTTPHNIATQNNLDNYIARVAKPLGLDMTFTVNYGSNPTSCNGGGTPAENAGNLVTYANVTKKYAIKRWEVGNEQYAYGSAPLIDLHPNPYVATLGAVASTYTQYEPAFYQAMKAADPSISIAVPSVGPNPGYNALVNYQLPLLQNASFDALILHNYPLTDPITDGATLYPDRVASGTQVRGTLLSYQTQLLDANKSPDAIWVTEWDDEAGGNLWSRQTLGGAVPLFAAMQLAEYMQAGVPFATWQAQGETDVCSSLNYDFGAETSYNWWDDCGSAALVYTGPIPYVGEESVGLVAGDLFPAGRAFQILSMSGFVTEGEHMVRTQTDATGAPWLMAYAATHGNSYAVLLINRDRDVSHQVPVSLAGMKNGGTVTQWTYGRTQYDQTRSGNWSVDPVTTASGAWSNTFNAELAPWSINVFVFTRAPANRW